jgi:hypothetical protein
LSAGTDFTSGTLGTTWASSVDANRAVGQTNLAAATSNYWQVTGVQLEVGTVATPFEHKPYGVELAECQRYYYKVTDASMAIYSAKVDSYYTTLTYPTTMRSTPTATEGSNSPLGGAVTLATFTDGPTNARIGFVTGSSSGNRYGFFAGNYTFDAEL